MGEKADVEPTLVIGHNRNSGKSRNMTKPDDPDVLLAREFLIQFYKDAYDRIKSDQTELEAQLIGEARALGDYLKACDSRTYCILVVSFMEDALRRLYVSNWKITKREDHDRYFGGNGPLSTFAQRVLIAKGLNWLTEEGLAEAHH